jgi:hypothetical protein
LNTDRSLDVPRNADLPQVYIASLAALIGELKSTGAGQQRYELENGKRVEGRESIYGFDFTDDAALFDDAKVEIDISGRRIYGSIVSISSGCILLSIGEELEPDALHRVILLIDATALLEALKQRIEDTHKNEISINRDIADAVVGKKPSPAAPLPIPEARSDRHLNPKQNEALRRALNASISYVWGPPGCGKTYVLSEIVRSGYEAGKRILVCSNTNKAVDQVLYRLCENLGTQHPAMQEGRIVRVGTIADDKLKDNYYDFVTVDGIVERRSIIATLKLA